MNPKVTCYRRERWETPDGKTIIAELDPGIVGGYGPNLHRLVLMLHFSGQMTCERIVALLNGMGVVISKRQVVRLLTARLETFRAEDEAVLNAGLGGASYVTVDDTGARHAGKNGYTTQIGSDRFTVFRTGPTKSRQAFLARLCGGAAFYVINEAALDYMQDAQTTAGSSSTSWRTMRSIFSASLEEWERHLQALGLADLKVAPDPVQIASEGALWGAIRHQGFLRDTVIVSDDAGQFRVGEHALCWVHAERLVHKLVPANDRQRNAVEVARRMIWWFYRALKEYKLAPSPEQAQVLRARFDRIFKRGETGYVTLDSLLRRLFRRKDELAARPRPAGNPPQHQRFGKRHPRLRHEKENLRRNRQRQRPRRSRRHARPGQDLHEARRALLQLSRIPPWRRGTKNPTPGQPHPPSPTLKPKRPPGNLPRLLAQVSKPL